MVRGLVGVLDTRDSLELFVGVLDTRDSLELLVGVLDTRDLLELLVGVLDTRALLEIFVGVLGTRGLLGLLVACRPLSDFFGDSWARLAPSEPLPTSTPVDLRLFWGDISAVTTGCLSC